MPRGVSKVTSNIRGAHVTTIPQAEFSATRGPSTRAPLSDPNGKLTDNQKKFVKCWAEGDSLSGAAIRAGLHPTNGYGMSKMPKIIKAYNVEKALYEEASQMSRKKVMDMLMEAYDMAKLTAEPATMVSAAREIGKMCGYYEPVKVNLNLSGSVAMQKMDAMSDADLVRLITEGVQAAAAQDEERELMMIGEGGPDHDSLEEGGSTGGHPD